MKKQASKKLQEICIFNFDDYDIRVFDRDGNSWFVLADVCRVLEIGNPSDAARRLDSDERRVVNIEGPENKDLSESVSRFGPQQMTLINESGLYSLILTSRKPEAKRFKKWITSVVLPTIRKTGSYSITGGSREYIREEGKKVRREFVSICASRGVKGSNEFRELTNATYQGLWGMNASEIREKNGLKKRANLRDHMGSVALGATLLSEAMASERVVALDQHGIKQCADSAHKCASAVKGAIVEERRTRKMITLE